MLPFSASDIIKALEAVPGWKAVMSLPKRLAELEARVAALEKGAGKPVNAATICPACALPLAFTSEQDDRIFGAHGVKIRKFHCTSCNRDSERQWSARDGYL
jgi:hypothetical protein